MSAHSHGIGVGTGRAGVEISDTQGRDVSLLWEDAITVARTVLVAADVRGLLPEPQTPVTDQFLLQLHGRVLTPEQADEMIAFIRTRVR